MIEDLVETMIKIIAAKGNMALTFVFTYGAEIFEAWVYPADVESWRLSKSAGKLKQIFTRFNVAWTSPISNRILRILAVIRTASRAGFRRVKTYERRYAS